MSSSRASPRWALLTGAAAAIGASLCCVVPLVLVSLGISGAWLASLTALEPYRPLFALVAVASLGIAAWRLYGPSSRCEDGRTCADPHVLRRRRRLLWIAVAVIAPLLLFPYYITWFV
ncbi:MAG: mercury transporter MerT [Proteobacteria bacterium]|nr:mercury transporter MerT [Pseudomonadota bacterium]